MNTKHIKVYILPLRKLKCGMILAESIYTKTHMILVPEGSMITEEVMQTLKFFSHQRQIGGRAAVQNKDYVGFKKPRKMNAAA